jgi:DegV family protein with EDD domain
VVAIVTDASVDLSPEQAAEAGAIIAPLTYELGGERLLTGSQSAAQFFAALQTHGEAAIAGVEADDFEAAFRQVVEGDDEVICICQSFGSSFTYVAAQVGSQRVQADSKLTVRIVNTGRSTAAQAAITLIAAAGAKAGQSMAEVLAGIERASTQAETFVIAPSVDQLDRAGQLKIVTSQSGVGPLEPGAPLFRVRDRLTAVAVADDSAGAESDLLDRAEQLADGSPVTLVVTHAQAPEAAQRLTAAAEQRLTVREAIVTEIGPTLGALLGPGAYGLGLCTSPDA